MQVVAEMDVQRMYGLRLSVGDGVSFEFTIGSGPGIRTLNLAVNRSLRPVQK